MNRVSVTCMVTHPRPHLDELAAIWALRRFGGNRYGGIEDAELVMFDPRVHEDGRSEDEWLGDGHVFVGVRGGKYDDHPHGRFPNDCAFTLVLQDVGRADDRALQKIAERVLCEDRSGTSDILHLANVVKNFHRVVGLKDICGSIELALEALYAGQRSFWEAVELLPRMDQIRVVHDMTGAPLWLVRAETANQDISAAARRRDGLCAALVAHYMPGTKEVPPKIYISANHQLGITDLSALAAELRWHEQAIAGVTRIKNRELLCADGTLPEIPEWYHFMAASEIFNGSLTHDGIPPTRLPRRLIDDLCVQFLRHYRFASGHPRLPKPKIRTP